MDRRVLRDELGVSRSTVHRLTRELQDQDLAVETDDGLELTLPGELLAEAVLRLETRLDAVEILVPLLEKMDHLPPGCEPEFFAEGTVTVQSDEDPYKPHRRFCELVDQTETIRGYDTPSPTPLYLEDVREAILEGMETAVVFPTEVAYQIAADYPDYMRELRKAEWLSISISDDPPPCGLALFDDRVALASYDPETGVLAALAETTDQRGREWAEAEFERVWGQAEPLDLNEIDL